MKKANLKLEKRIEINVYRIAPIAGIWKILWKTTTAFNFWDRKS
jgi:hypothetical protein